MTDEPMVWHYGLMAERWAEFINDRGSCKPCFYRHPLDDPLQCQPPNLDFPICTRKVDPLAFNKFR